jgi:hypothetical protein
MWVTRHYLNFKLIKKMFFHLSNIIVSRFVKLAKLPNFFPYLFRGLIGVTSSMFISYGIFPTLRVIWALGRTIGQPLENLISLGIRLPHLNNYILSNFNNILIPFWVRCCLPGNIKNFTKVYRFFMFVSILSSILPYFRFITNFTMGTLLTCLGFIWTDSSLLLIKPFKVISEYILDVFNLLTGIYFPSIEKKRI